MLLWLCQTVLQVSQSRTRAFSKLWKLSTRSSLSLSKDGQRWFDKLTMSGC